MNSATEITMRRLETLLARAMRLLAELQVDLRCENLARTGGKAPQQAVPMQATEPEPTEDWSMDDHPAFTLTQGQMSPAQKAKWGSGCPACRGRCSHC